ncbi:hypothetical protein [Pseudorhodoferax sp.]|uniref:hypothetical protein n=1 Tax=Pseudorhodoferax sp. TaxID=1993553 RepID=UPI002DD61ABB|nr:hypothetical protein [Pseudorhodoferax sp.]
MDERDKTGIGVGAAVGGVTGGVAGAAAAGAAIGGVTGPVGAAAGAVAGAVVGAMAGKGLARTADLAEEEKYWRSNYSSRPYASGASYDDYGPAYMYGAGAYARYPGRSFDEAEPELSSAWAASRGASTLAWSSARHASRDAWQRVGDTSRASP